MDSLALEKEFFQTEEATLAAVPLTTDAAETVPPDGRSTAFNTTPKPSDLALNDSAPINTFRDAEPPKKHLRRGRPLKKRGAGRPRGKGKGY